VVLPFPGIRLRVASVPEAVAYSLERSSTLSALGAGTPMRRKYVSPSYNALD